MTIIKIGCRNSITSTKERNLDLILVRGGTTTNTYKAFEASVPDKGKPGESITVTCPHCGRHVKINTGVEYSNVLIKNSLKMGVFVSMTIILLSGFMGLIMEDIRMMWLMMIFILPILAIGGGFYLLHLKIRSKNGVYYGAPNIVDEYHFINY